MRHRILKAICFLVIFFFTWTAGGIFNIAYAAYNETQNPPVNQKQEQRPEEKFQKAIEDIKNIIQDKADNNESKSITSKISAVFETKKSRLKAKKDEIESFDNEIRSQFAATEKKLKDAGLPQEILQRHYNFVKHYEDNLQELRTNLEAADKAKTKAEFDTQIQKVQRHLEKVAPPKKHKVLDPNKLPHRISDLKRKEPRTKPQDFQKDIKQTASVVIPLAGQSPAHAGGIQESDNSVIPVKTGIQPTTVIPVQTLSPAYAGGIQKTKNTSQPLLLASNGPLTGLVEKLPKYEEQQNLHHPLFSKEGRSSFNSPPLAKGDTGGFSSVTTEPIILAQAGNPPKDADLAETIDVQLTSAIRAKAAELNYSPVKIYNWVRNNVEYVPTYGSIQGADMCLQTKQGNDFDIASLLIALLRASNIPAKYVYGTIELPIDKVMNWVGGFTDANAALNFIASGGTPVAGLISGGKISSARMEHVWVEAYINYYPLRGAAHKTGKGDTWIPLDASYKQYTYTQGIDIKTAVPFDAQTFVNQIQATATIDQANSSVTGINSTYIQQQMQNYQAQVKNYIDQNYPNATAGDVLGKKEIIQQKFTYLLGTLPYRKWTIGVKYAEIPDNLRHKITFSVTKDIYDSEMGTPINITKRLPEIAGKKITLSYSPATAKDEATINSYLPKPHADGTPIQPNELPTSLPAYLINLKPELRIDGIVVATGTAIGMGMQETFDMVFTEPGPAGTTDIVSNPINAGAYYAVAIDAAKITENQLHKLQLKMDDTKAKIATNNFTGLTTDDIVGDFLYAAALAYYMQLDIMNNIRSKTVGLVNVRCPSESIFGLDMNVDMMFGVPRSVRSGGFMMDVDRNMNLVQALDGNNKNRIQFNITSGMNSSALEHSIPEQLFSLPEKQNAIQAISAVKCLKIANEQGIPIFSLNQSNVNTTISQLQLSTEVKTEIQNAINTGKIVTVSKTNISYAGWTGCGYIIIDPITGNGAYMLSGGLSGGWINFDGVGDCEKSYLERALNNFILTNNVIPGILAPPALGMLLGLPRAVASMLGTITLWQWARTLFAAAIMEGIAYTALETGILVGATALFSFVLAGLAWEIGLLIGSLISAAIIPCSREG